MNTLKISAFLAVLLIASTASARVDKLATDPYVGAIVMDADTGQVLFADKADTPCYPASVLKLMDLYVILDRVKAGALRLDDKVRVTAEASRIGGSQVYLKEHEEFTIDDLLYALMIQSANDAATALAIHIAGTKDGFVSLMNEKARELGMTSTRFHSVHGLPPGPNQEPDITTARDLTILCRALAKLPEAFRYTSTKERSFREASGQPFIMRNHNNLLGRVDGVDGFKTGYFSAAGFSIAATAERGGTRIIAVVLGSTSKQTRDAKASELLAKGFLIVPPKQVVTPPPPVPAPSVSTITSADETDGEMADDEPADVEEEKRGGFSGLSFLFGIVVGIIGGVVGVLVAMRPGRNTGEFVKR